MKTLFPKMDPSTFAEFYGFVFDYQLEKGKKILDIQTAIITLRAVLPEKPHVNAFCDFLEVPKMTGVSDFDRRER